MKIDSVSFPDQLLERNVSPYMTCRVEVQRGQKMLEVTKKRWNAKDPPWIAELKFMFL